MAGFKDRLKADDGTTGRDVGVCIITDLRRKEAFCHAVAVFPEGRLFFEWLNRESSKRQTVAVVGGTGAYDDARGSAVAQEARRKTNITVTSSARATTDVQTQSEPRVSVAWKARPSASNAVAACSRSPRSPRTTAIARRAKGLL